MITFDPGHAVEEPCCERCGKGLVGERGFEIFYPATSPLIPLGLAIL